MVIFLTYWCLCDGFSALYINVSFECCLFWFVLISDCFDLMCICIRYSLLLSLTLLMRDGYNIIKTTSMTSTNQITSRAFAGSRRKTCCARLAGCACHRPDSGTVSTPVCFGSNFSQSQNGFTYFGFNKCKDLRCKIKCNNNNLILPLNNCKSFVNGRNFVLRSDDNLNCSSANVIYLISCTVCHLQYVGETGRAANVRWAEHLAKIRKGERGQLIYSHFNSDDAHKNVPLEKRLRFQIIEKVRTDDLLGLEPGLIRKRRVDREMFWMSALMTVAPLGLNDKIEGFGMRGMTSERNVNGFNMYRIVNICKNGSGGFRRGRHRKKARGRIDDSKLGDFKADLLRLSQDCASRLENFILSKPRLFLERFVKSSHSNGLERGLSYLVSSCVDYHRKPRPGRKSVPEILFNVDFSHKILSDVNISSILGNSSVKGLLPASLRNQFDIRLVFRYSKTIGSKILNYNSVLRDSGVTCYNDIGRLTCDCDSSPFKHSVLGHVTTGNLDIIEDCKLRELFSFGAKFRENPLLNLSKIKKDIARNIDNLKSKIARKFLISVSCFKNWKKCFLKNFNNKLITCSKNFSYRLPTLSDNSSKRELSRLKDKYVITVVDKAANNFAFTCKKFYFLKLATELGMDNVRPGNDTYVHCVIISEPKTDGRQMLSIVS